MSKPKEKINKLDKYGRNWGGHVNVGEDGNADSRASTAAKLADVDAAISVETLTAPARRAHTEAELEAAVGAAINVGDAAVEEFHRTSGRDNAKLDDPSHARFLKDKGDGVWESSDGMIRAETTVESFVAWSYRDLDGQWHQCIVTRKRNSQNQSGRELGRRCKGLRNRHPSRRGQPSCCGDRTVRT